MEILVKIGEEEAKSPLMWSLKSLSAVDSSVEAIIKSVEGVVLNESSERSVKGVELLLIL